MKSIFKKNQKVTVNYMSEFLLIGTINEINQLFTGETLISVDIPPTDFYGRTTTLILARPEEITHIH